VSDPVVNRFQLELDYRAKIWTVVRMHGVWVRDAFRFGFQSSSKRSTSSFARCRFHNELRISTRYYTWEAVCDCPEDSSLKCDIREIMTRSTKISHVSIDIVWYRAYVFSSNLPVIRYITSIFVAFVSDKSSNAATHRNLKCHRSVEFVLQYSCFRC